MQEKKEEEILKKYSKICTEDVKDFISRYDENGLSSSKAAEHIRNYGINSIKQAKPKKWYHFFFGSLFSTFNKILIGIAIILCYTDVILADKPNWANIIVISILVIVSTLLEFFEEYHSNKAAEKLKEMVSAKSTVLRDGKQVDLPVKEITVGDVVLLSAGDMIPADMRIIEAKDLYVGQSALTGESESVQKFSSSNAEEIETISDLDTICFMGTNVISGSAKGIIFNSGDNTYLGKIVKSIAPQKPKTAFQKGIDSISKLLVRIMIILIPIVFLATVTKHSLVTSFTFAVAIAIAITPLLLPVILSSSLSKGAVKMSKKKTIVKRLDSIQTFGSMGILCTDKTGTLTEDKIVIEKYLDVKGEEDTRILKHAFLNSYFQTGLEGNIDVAVIDRAMKNGMEEYTKTYKKVDEIPFDFSRRRLSVVVTDGTKKQLITKGAVEEILNICDYYDYKGEVSKLTREAKSDFLNITKKLNEEGLRVIAVCQKNEVNHIANFSVADEKNMVLLGFIGFLDPPKESAAKSIKKLNEAGIRVIVLTGDNKEVTKNVCKRVGINSLKIVIGSDIDKISDRALSRLLKKVNIFAKLSPIQKARIVRVLKENGNVVGYMGDGINDSPSLSNADVGISVDTAVDIAKESADIILLEKDLHVLLDGVTEGRKTYTNLMKYIKLAISFNFGEVVSVIIASFLLPFLPETPIQLLVEGLLYDFGQMTIPFDNVDPESLKKRKEWSNKSLKHFMFFMGPLSSIFDMMIFALVWFRFGIREAAVFQTIWFTYSIVSNLFGLHIIRTAKKPFIESHASWPVYMSTLIICCIAIILPYSALGSLIGLVPVTLNYLNIILGIPVLYCVVALFAKKIYIKKYKEWI